MKNILKPVMDILNSLFREGFEKFGRYYSSYRGFVADNEDPDSWGRLKLVVPQISGKFVIDTWAWPKGNFSGDNYGSQCIPKKGDMVWVEFEMGNPRKPLWKHGHFSFKTDGITNEKPTNLRDINNYWFKTPGGHLIEIDDTNEWILITTSGGGKFKIDTKIKMLDGNSPAVLGDKNNETLSAIKDLLQDISTTLGNIGSTDAIALAALAGTYGITLTYGSTFVSKSPDWVADIADIQTKISNNNSQDITLK